jgi:beta-galactosidase
MIKTPLRQRVDISTGWEFAKGRVNRRWLQGRGGGGETVDLPHCWNQRDTFQPGRRSYSGKGAYRRSIDLPGSPGGPGAWRLRSEGFYGFGDLWIDGRAVAVIDGQYLGIDLTLPASLVAGRHLVALRLENLFQRRVLPGRSDPDFLLYGGLAGRVWLEWMPAFHIDESATEVVCKPGPDGAEILELRCRVNGMTTPQKNPRLSWIITTGGGDQIAAAGPTPVGDGEIAISTMILQPRCWSPDDPCLYSAEGTLASDQGTADSICIRFGITRAEFRPEEGFFLDGKRIDLHGCNRHESIPGLGNALPEELHRADASLLKDYGCNFVRLSHYPQHPSFLDACDELGILVYAEIASWKSVSSSRVWRRAARRQMRDLILRDRHHPSVILWGMGNESRSRIAFLELREIARELDPARAVTYAENHLRRARREKTVGIPEVWSVNYELEKLEEARDACSLHNVVVAECCNYPRSTRGDDGAEATQVATLEYEWTLMADRPYLAGHAVWSFSDYATEYRRRFRRQSGLFDAWRKPKMAAEMFRARYAKKPFISLIPTGVHRERQLHVFTNCRGLRLSIDDAPSVELGIGLHHTVPVAEEFTRITVEGERNEHRVVEVLKMWREASTLTLDVCDPASAGTTIAVDLSVVDGNGNPVRDWNGTVETAVDGDARLLSFNDGDEVLAARGQARIYVEIGRSGAEFAIRAGAAGLEPATTTVTPSAKGAADVEPGASAPGNGRERRRSRGAGTDKDGCDQSSAR